MTKKVLIVDDSALMRRVLSDIIAADKRFELTESASNGMIAYDLIKADPSKYDMVILDINMPKMSGIELLEKLNAEKIHINVIIVSTIAKQGAAETIRCLELGAFDFITKPDSFVETKSKSFGDKILDYMCEALKMSRSETTQPPQTGAVPSFVPRTGTTSEKGIGGPMSYVKVTSFKKLPHKSVSPTAKKIVAIACSTGGPKALQQVIPLLPKDLNAPVLLVQHMPAGFTGSLASRLDEMSAVKVSEAADGEVIEKGHVYIAKGGNHLRLIKRGMDYCIELGSEPPRDSLRPCADIMYESLYDLDFDEIICVVLTGMGSDGTRGIGKLGTRKNLYVIAQDEASSTVYGMPRMVYEAGITDEVVPLGSIADAVRKIVGTR
ncbi:MAG: chemotaxis-specific protein-glutamate methyltransferase CheB [Lachnospiraceae bacterium]|nr:chemotaxis-specific protein-glutamate methyltransferase CheB [Lachnospiraceae bacterium]